MLQMTHIDLFFAGQAPKSSFSDNVKLTGIVIDFSAPSASPTIAVELSPAEKALGRYSNLNRTDSLIKLKLVKEPIPFSHGFCLDIISKINYICKLTSTF